MREKYIDRKQDTSEESENNFAIVRKKGETNLLKLSGNTCMVSATL